MLLTSSAISQRQTFLIPLHLTFPSFASRSPGIANPYRILRNIHPCAYDAYGMTCVEAAACGVASAMGEGVGAKALLEDATLTLQMPKEVR